MFLLAWIFLGAAIATLYFGLSEEGRAFLYLSMAASAITAVLAVAQLFRRVQHRVDAGPAWDPTGPSSVPAIGHGPSGSSDPDPGAEDADPERGTTDDGEADGAADGPRDRGSSSSGSSSSA